MEIEPTPVALGIFWFIDQSSANFYDQRERRNNSRTLLHYADVPRTSVKPVSSDFQCFLRPPSESTLADGQQTRRGLAACEMQFVVNGEICFLSGW